MTIDRERLADQAIAVTVADLMLEGLIQILDEDKVLLTDDGVSRAFELWRAHSYNERALLMLLVEAIDRAGEEKAEHDKS